MAVGATRIRLNEAAISAINYPGGMVSVRVGIVAEQIATLARVYSPKRTGQMVLNIGTEHGYARRTGCSFRVVIDVPYATYVLRGTYGPIHGKLRRDTFGRFTGRGTDIRGRPTGNRNRLPVGRSQGGPVTWAHSVAGQTANDFLSTAAREVLARYGI
jgi:hypothetical protein